MENFTHNIDIRSDLKFEKLLTKEALDFLLELHLKFNSKRKQLLEERVTKMKAYNEGELPSFPVETKNIREEDWQANTTPKDLQDRRVEITGPVDRKMIINALNSDAKVFMSDFEDASSPTWENMMNGQVNLKDAHNNTIDFSVGEKSYKLGDNPAVLKVRPRGLHLVEKHLNTQEEPLSASLVDFGLYFFHNIKERLSKNTSTYFYIPKLEYYQEAKWWSEVFEFSEGYMGVPKGSIKCTVLIETITASFALDEIIYSLKDYIVGLNCGRWDYIFSYIKKLKNTKSFAVPNRDQITMETPFMDAYAKKVVQVCHRRGIHAIGGMAAQIPIKNDPEANQKALNKVKTDKLREVKNGHDGTWVAHPALVKVAQDVFDEYMPNANQKDKIPFQTQIEERDLIELPKGFIDEHGIRKNINVGLLYIESWLMGTGAAALYHLMEDAATAEISRTQLWLWIQQKAQTMEGKKCEKDWIENLIDEELVAIKTYVGPERFESGKFTLAKQLFAEMIFADQLDEFLTTKAYDYLA